MFGGSASRRLMLAAATAVLTLPVAFSPVSAAAEGGPPPVPADAILSLNWAGYVRVGDSYNDVRASWVQPSVQCHDQADTSASFWVGMGGVFSPYLEQIGTEAACINGETRYSTWLEMLPNPIQRLSLRVRPGDRVTAGVRFDGAAYTLTLATSSGGTFSKSFAGSGDNNSVEWITEAPANCDATSCSIIPIADFGQVHFKRATAAPDTGTTLEIVMVDPTGSPLAVPGPFAHSSFDVTGVSRHGEGDNEHFHGERHSRLTR